MFDHLWHKTKARPLSPQMEQKVIQLEKKCRDEMHSKTLELKTTFDRLQTQFQGQLQRCQSRGQVRFQVSDQVANIHAEFEEKLQNARLTFYRVTTEAKYKFSMITRIFMLSWERWDDDESASKSSSDSLGFKWELGDYWGEYQRAKEKAEEESKLANWRFDEYEGELECAVQEFVTSLSFSLEYLQLKMNEVVAQKKWEAKHKKKGKGEVKQGHWSCLWSSQQKQQKNEAKPAALTVATTTATAGRQLKKEHLCENCKKKLPKVKKSCKLDHFQSVHQDIGPEVKDIDMTTTSKPKNGHIKQIVQNFITLVC